MIYVHFPFCKSFCTYCDFYSVRERSSVRQYKDSLLREISARKAAFLDCAEPGTLYIGGGTPSLCPVDFLEEILTALYSVLPAVKSGFSEFTVEVNPDDITEEYASALRKLGVNRVSMGVQSFSDVSLRWMNRRHDASGVRAAYRILRSAGFDNISLDLIFGYDPAPWGGGPTPEGSLMQMWRQDLEAMLELRPEHISAYQMGLEEDSALGRKASEGKYREPDEDICAKQYSMLQEMLRKAGYRQYEVSNFAIPGREAVHNSGYWERFPYIGLGPGAHSFDGRRRRSWNIPDVGKYISLPCTEVSEYETLTDEDVTVEKIMLGLRKVSGLNLSDVPELDGARVCRLLDLGLLEKAGGRIRIPEQHLFISDSIIRELL